MAKSCPKHLPWCVLLVLSYSCRPSVVLRKSRRKEMSWLGEFRKSTNKERTEHRCELCRKPTELVWTGEILINLCYNSIWAGRHWRPLRSRLSIVLRGVDKRQIQPQPAEADVSFPVKSEKLWISLKHIWLNLRINCLQGLTPFLGDLSEALAKIPTCHALLIHIFPRSIQVVKQPSSP